MTASSDGQRTVWSDEDKRREREVCAAEIGSNAQKAAAKTQRRSVWIQAIALIFTFAATAATAVAAFEAANAVKTTQNIAAQQATENQEATAVTALGSNSLTDQISGLALIARNVETQLDTAIADPSQRQEANEAYADALSIFDAYLRITPTSDSNDPIAVEYAADELLSILEMGPKLKTIDEGQPPLSAPSIDLSLVALPGIEWKGIRFDWLASAYMPEIDLEGADLADSHWGHATLTGANLQCADLRNADLRQANLTGADLRGADLGGALLPPPADLEHVNTTGAIGAVNGLAIVDPGTSYDPTSCFGSSPSTAGQR
jgi:uncharacterized protein YjbI with pentapeptide repeats